MCQCKNFQTSPALKRWIQQGYKLCFVFIEDRLVQLSDMSISYPISTLRPDPKPCVDGEIIVYLLSTPDGRFGHAVLPFHEAEAT
jgi:hypothetical protein